MHQSPSNNYVDHGFYQFSPTFFADYYLENKYRLVEIKFVRHSRNVEGEPWMFLNYQPGDLDGISFGGLGHDLPHGFACAESRGVDLWPSASQGLYRAMAAGNNKSVPGCPARASREIRTISQNDLRLAGSVTTNCYMAAIPEALAIALQHRIRLAIRRLLSRFAGRFSRSSRIIPTPFIYLV